MKTRLLLFSIILLTMEINVYAQVGSWKLNNNASDASVNAYNGTIINGATFTTDSKEGSHALSTNGTNQYIDLGNPPGLPSGNTPRSISAWAKTSNVTGNRAIVSFGTALSGQAMFIGQSGTSLIGGAFTNNSTVTNFWATGVWHHICLTYNGTIAKIYADGIEVSSTTKAWNLTLLRAYIGRGINNADYWSGNIDDVRIYNKALTPSEVQVLATAPPKVPTNFSAVAESSAVINLFWTDASTNETGFQIERSLNSASGYSVIATTPANVITYSNTGLNPGTTYYYRISAINAGGASVLSPVVNATTIVQAPIAPTGLSATAVSTTSITLSWTDVSSNETGFQVERSLTSGSGYTLIATTTVNANSFADTGLTPGTLYFYRIRSINAGGNSPYTAESGATTISAGPIAPAGLTAVAASTNSINLSWTDASSDETGFQIERSLTSDGGYALIATSDPNTTSYASTGLTPGTRYYYRVRSTNSFGNSPYTIVATAVTVAPPPLIPTLLKAVTQSSSEVLLTWSDGSTNETGFQIERSLTAGSGYELIYTVTVDATSFSSSNLSSKTKYYFRIRAINGGGNSPYTPEVNATTFDSPPLPAASLRAESSSNTGINLSWVDKSNNETGFEIERSLTSDSGFKLIATTEPNATTYSNSGIPSGKAYYYRVRAKNDGGKSVYSNVAGETLFLDGVTQLCSNLYCDSKTGGIGIGIQTIPSGYRLAVKGKVMAEGVKIDLQKDWPDYVFEKNYVLRDIPSLEKYIQDNGHLPNLPAAETVKKEGMDIEEINVLLLEKIEEMSLYLIQMEERMKKLETENSKLKKDSKK